MILNIMSILDLPDSVLSAAISAAGVILSAIISAWVSWCVARKQARSEIERMERAWRRKDDESFIEDFHTCCRCVQNYLENPTSKDRHRIALRSVQLLRAAAPDTLVAILRKLQASIEAGDFSQAAVLLDRLIDSSQKTVQ